MAIERFERPEIKVEDGRVYHVLVADTSNIQEMTTLDLARSNYDSLGCVEVGPIEMQVNDHNGFKLRSYGATLVTGLVGGNAVFEKVVDPKGYLGIPRPFYVLRIARARKRAGRVVNSMFSEL
jgi:hypothetical protein